MKNRSLKTAAAIVLAVTALGLSACSSSDDSASGPSTSAAAGGGAFENGKGTDGKEEGAAPATTTPPNLPKPTADALNARINKALSGQLTDQEKLTYIEDADRDPQLVDKFVEAAKKNNVKVTIVKVDGPNAGKLKAGADVTIDGKPVNNASVEFVAVDKDWLVSHDFACNIVKAAKLDSAACQA